MPPPSVSRVSSAGSVPARVSRHRLRKHADFEQVYRRGRRLFSAHMTVFFLQRDRGPARVGFTVPRALGPAVERNRMRRRMREAARLNLSAAGEAVDVVIHPKKSALTAEFAGLCQEMARAFEKIKSQVAGAGMSSAVGPRSSAKDGESVSSQ